MGCTRSTSGLAAALQQAGVAVLLLDGDWSDQAGAANEFDADVYVGLAPVDDSIVEASYFAVPGFESEGGRRLAELIIKELPASPGWGVGTVHGHAPADPPGDASLRGAAPTR